MTGLLSTVLGLWWVVPILLALIGYKFILRVFFGMIIVPEDKIGLVTKKFVLSGQHKELPDGRIIATKGEAGNQARPLSPGLHWGMWPWQYSIKLENFTIIPTGRIGLVDAKDGAALPVGNILGRRVDCDNFQDTEAFLSNGGQKGKQTIYLPAGVYRINTHAFHVETASPTVIPENQVGIVITLDGDPLEPGHIAGQEVKGHNNFQDFDAFLSAGGQRGLQPQVIQAGSYYINPWAVKVETQPMTEIPIGHVGVIISYIGEEGKDITGEGFKHGNIVKKGERGVWDEPLGPGKYALNNYTHKIEKVPTTNLVLNWANARNESHNLDKNLSTITVRSNDGFPFNLDVSQIIHVPASEAPKVIARFGSMNNLVSQVLEPTIGNYFRNSAQTSDVIAFLSERKQRQNEAKAHISEVLSQYNVHAVDTLIGDIAPPKELMKTLTDRKIAEEEKKTFDTQKEAQIQRQSLQKETAIADMQPEIVKATQSVEIAQRTADSAVKTAEGQATSLKLAAEAQAQVTKVKASADAEAQKVKAEADAKTKTLNAEADAKAVKLKADADAEQYAKVGKAEAEAILAKGEATANSYKLQVEAMGEDNFAKLKIAEQIAEGRIKVIPDMIINGGNSVDGSMSGLLGMQLLNMLQDKVA